MAKEHFKYAPGDQVKDVTFDPPLNGVVTAKHEKPDAYYARLAGGSNDVTVHARNLQMA